MPANEKEVSCEEYEKNRRGNVGRGIHWSGVGCTFPDQNASLVPDQEEGYYDTPCPNKTGAGCSENGMLDVA